MATKVLQRTLWEPLLDANRTPEIVAYGSEASDFLRRAPVLFLNPGSIPVHFQSKPEKTIFH
jgi:hypothetical protein